MKCGDNTLMVSLLSHTRASAETRRPHHGDGMPTENHPPGLTSRRGTDLAFGQLGEAMEPAYDLEGRRLGIMALKQQLDYSDLASAPDDGLRYELLDGELLVTPSPSLVHQRVSRRLQRQLEDYFHTTGRGEVFDAPSDVILTPHDVVEPDLLVVTDARQFSRRGVEGPPALVVEILSPSTRDRDQTVKARRYAVLGIPHYWIVDPDALRIAFYRAEGPSYVVAAVAEGDTTVEAPGWPGLTIAVGELWKPSPLERREGSPTSDTPPED